MRMWEGINGFPICDNGLKIILNMIMEHQGTAKFKIALRCRWNLTKGTREVSVTGREFGDLQDTTDKHQMRRCLLNSLNKYLLLKYNSYSSLNRAI